MKENNNISDITWTPVIPKSTQPPSGNSKGKRPFLISIMIALSTIGILGLIGAVVAAGRTEGAEAAGHASIMALPLFAIFAGMALGGWRAARYGWWALGIYSVYSIARGPIIILTAMALAEQLDPGTLTKQIVRGIGPILYGAFFFIYVFRTNVREYFQVATSSKMKQIFILGGLFVLFLIGFLSQSLPLIMGAEK